MKAMLFLQGSLGALNSRDGRPLFMDPVHGRPLLNVLMGEASSSGVFDRMVFVTSAAACDDAVVGFLAEAWPSVEVVRIEADSPHAFGAGSRRERLLTVEDSAGILSVEGFKAIAARFVRDPSQVAFVLDVNDAPLCSRRFFEQAVPLAREVGFHRVIAPGTASLCGFQMRNLDTMSAHQRSLRVAESATVKERVERVMQEARRERYLDSDEQIDTVHAWQRARAESYAPRQGGLLQHTVRDYVARHADGDARDRFVRETLGTTLAVTTLTALAMVRAAFETPDACDLGAAQRWLLEFEERRPHREGQRRFWPDYPSYLEVELTSRCNLACRFCPQTKLSRPKGDLEYEKLEALLDRVGDFVTLLNFSGFGEPTLHARLFDCVRLAKAKGIPRVEIETNGTTIDEAFLDEVFASGLDVLSINLDAADLSWADPSRSDEGGKRTFGSVYELVKRFIERRGGAGRPFLALQRVNMAVAGQDAKVQRDFALWYDVADAFVIKPFNTYRGTFPDKRVINFAPLERGGCRKVLASALLLSSGEVVMCEQCFDGERLIPDALLEASGECPGAQRFRYDTYLGIVEACCASCTQWYQTDLAWMLPGASRVWFEQALGHTAQRVARAALESSPGAVADTGIAELVRRSGDFGEAVEAAYADRLGAERWEQAAPAWGRSSAAVLGSNPFGRATACAVHGGVVYVADAAQRCIHVFSPEGGRQQAAGQLEGLSGRLTDLPDVIVHDGQLLVGVDDRIWRYTLDGTLAGSIALASRGSLTGIAGGPPGAVFAATTEGRVVLFDTQTNAEIASWGDSLWLRLHLGSSTERRELYVALRDRHELHVYDFDGALRRRISRDEIGRLNWPFHMVRCGDEGYAVSNHAGEEVLLLSPELEYVAAIAVGGRPRRLAYADGRLFVVNGTTQTCHIWELSGQRSTVRL
ncbi:MAG: radical SAM protein [Verrucomicrobia bacterium]|nr:radical SAM protein [Verrucomicrobiota bacterium]